MQQEDGMEQPIAHASKTLNESPNRYSQIEKEALSIIYGVVKFRQCLYSREFMLVTDHKQLVSIFSPDRYIPVLTAQRLQRWALTLMAYQYRICYKSTTRHGNADGLSRLPEGTDLNFDKQESEESTEISHTLEENIRDYPVDVQAVREATEEDTSVQHVLKWISDGSCPLKLSQEKEYLRAYWNMRIPLCSHNGVLLLQKDGYTRVVIPKVLQEYVLNTLHTSHWGTMRMKQLARQYVWWSNINSDIEQ
jgi:hypothetical protein